MERYVLEALQKGVITAVAASDLPAANVKYVGRVFNPPDDAEWLELVYIPNNPTGEFWGSQKTYRGVLRLILHSPMKDQGIYGQIDTLQSILDNLNKGTRLADEGQNVIVKVTEVPNILNTIEEPPEILIPASIRYSFFSS